MQCQGIALAIVIHAEGVSKFSKDTTHMWTDWLTDIRTGRRADRQSGCTKLVAMPVLLCFH